MNIHAFDDQWQKAIIITETQTEFVEGKRQDYLKKLVIECNRLEIPKNEILQRLVNNYDSLAYKEIDITGALKTIESSHQACFSADTKLPTVSLFANCKSLDPQKISLLELLNNITNGKYSSLIKNLRSLKEPNFHDFKTSSIPAFTPSGLFNGGRKKEYLVNDTSIVALDIDGLEKHVLETTFSLAMKVPFTLSVFRSPSGNGLKILVFTDNTNATLHTEAYHQAADYYGDLLNVKIDSSGKDITRLCIVSDDPTGYINCKPEYFPLAQSVCLDHKEFDAKYKQASYWTERIYGEFKNGIRNNFIHLLACNCNRLGLDHEAVEKKVLSEYLSNYDDEQAIKATIKSAYKNRGEFAKVADFAKPQLSSELELMPYIPDKVYQNLPDILKKGASMFSDKRQKDIFLTGALGVLSGCMPTVYGVYDQQKVHANLYTFVSAPAGNGKGALIHAKSLGLFYHRELKTKSLDNSNLLFVPGNVSSAALMTHLDRNGGKGIFFETEADTISGSLKQDWGDFSDILRKAYHHEPVMSLRKTNNENLEVERPMLSVVLSGTPSQVPNLIPSAENGLFSRFLFYSFRATPYFRDVSPSDNTPNLDDFFANLGEECHELIEILNQVQTIEFRLSDQQWRVLIDKQTVLLKTFISDYGDATSGLVNRIGLMWFRIAMLLSAFRGYHLTEKINLLVCTDLDFEVADMLVDTYKVHNIQMYQSLPRQEERNNPQMNRFYNALPREFDREELLEIAKEMGIPKRTAEGYRMNLEKIQKVEKIKHGSYRKIIE